MALAGSANAAVEGEVVTQNIAASAIVGTPQTKTISIDIDGDGNTEFDLVGYFDSGPREVYVRVVPVEAGAQVVGQPGLPVLADKLTAAIGIDGNSTYVGSANLAQSETKGDFGNWVPVSQRGYVGVAFDFEGNTHYGSLDVELAKFNAVYLSTSSEFDATLHGYVWETIPGIPILAGAEVSAPLVPSVAVPVAPWPFTLALIAGLFLFVKWRLRLARD